MFKSFLAEDWAIPYLAFYGVADAGKTTDYILRWNFYARRNRTDQRNRRRDHHGLRDKS